MNKEIKRIKNCLKTMKNCLKVTNVEKCICFSDAFKVLNLEASELNKKVDQTSELKSREKLISIKNEIEEIRRIIPKGKKECLGCNPCIAGLVFKSYPHRLNTLYLDNKI